MTAAYIPPRNWLERRDEQARRLGAAILDATDWGTRWPGVRDLVRLVLAAKAVQAPTYTEGYGDGCAAAESYRQADAAEAAGRLVAHVIGAIRQCFRSSGDIAGLTATVALERAIVERVSELILAPHRPIGDACFGERCEPYEGEREQADE